MEIITFGNGERLKRCASFISEHAADSLYERLILLPIPTTKDGKYITATSVPLDEVVALSGDGTLVAGYEIPHDTVDAIVSAGADVYDAGRDEGFLLENAAISAHGVIGYILSSLKKDISELKIGVVGYGRIGEALVRGLLFFGAHVVVYTERERVALSLCESGVSAKTTLTDEKISSLDLLVNTSPAKKINSQMLCDTLRTVTVIDVASGKAVDDGENVVRLMSIPERMYPETAGRAYARFVLANMGCTV